MTRYENLKNQPKKFLSLTGYTLQEFATLLPYVSQRFLAYVETHTLEGNQRRKNASIRLTKIVVYQVLKISCFLFSFTYAKS